MRYLWLCAGLLWISVNCAHAQSGRCRQYQAPLAGTVDFGKVEDKYNASVYSLEAPEVEGEEDMERLKEVKSASAAKFPIKASGTRKKTTAAPMPVLGINFVADSISQIPPDNYSAVSKDYKAVAVINSNFTVYDALSGAYLYRKGLKVVSAAVGLNNAIYDYRFDPKVIYDPEADKFICIMLNGTNQYNWVVVGFSQTNDPAGAWNYYKFYGDYTGDTTWFDYPALTITKDELFFTGNKIKYNTSWQAGFKQTLIYQVRKADGYSGSTLTYRIWDSIGYDGRNLRCLYPVKPADGLTAPAQYFLSNRNFDLLNDTVFVVKVPDVIGAPDSTLTVTPLVSSLSYGVPPDGRQPDTSVTLATNDGRVLGGFMKGDQIQFVSTSVNPLNGASGVYHGIINNVSGSPALTGKLFSIDTLDFGYPNISYAGNFGGSNQSIISFEHSGPNKYPGYGAVFFDGTDFSDMLTIKTGDSSIKVMPGKQQRWGDYSGSQPEWNAIGVVWVDGIFGRKNKNYGNYMAQLVSPNFTGVPTVAPKISETRLYPVPAMQYVKLEFSLEKAQGYSFYIYDVAGKVVDKILDRYCSEGRNIIQFNTAALPSGTYFLRAAGEDGTTIPVKSFVR
jgi:hypothetical protein